MKFKLKSFAKLNLSLIIFNLNKESQLHPISSIFQQISLHDTLTITVESSKTPQLILSNSGIKIPNNNKNIIETIFETFVKELSNSYTIHINKNIPLGSGMGGASSNAATFLKAINTIEKKYWDYQTLIQLGKSFGSDIPFFLHGGTQEISGYGDIMKPQIQEKKRFFVIIYPEIKCSTKEIYQHFDTLITKDAKKIKASNNNLLPVVLDFNKNMNTIYNALSNKTSYKIQLTGSGSTFFIETLTKEESLILQQSLSKEFNNFLIKTVESINSDKKLTINE